MVATNGPAHIDPCGFQLCHACQSLRDVNTRNRTLQSDGTEYLSYRGHMGSQVIAEGRPALRSLLLELLVEERNHRLLGLLRVLAAETVACSFKRQQIRLDI